MSDVKTLQADRTKMFDDLYSNIVPKRVPVNISLPFEPVAQYGGINLIEAQWNPGLVAEAADKICQDLYSDINPFGGALRYPSFYTALKSQSFVMGSNGFIQHPEVIGMLPEEYDYLIEKPLDCLYEKVLTRQFKALDLKDPINTMLSFTKGVMAFGQDFGTTGSIIGALNEKYGYYGGGIFDGGFTEAPADFLADQLRSFKGFVMDMRRMGDKVLDACEALYPIVREKGMPKEITNNGSVFFPLHMPTFMREKDFATYWWPSFKKLIHEYASLGIHSTLFCEDDWTRYTEYLYELPVDTRLMFEYGDARKIKDKLGRKHIITGFYPVTLLKIGTKQQCIDKAKEYIDILAPGGKYMFSLDKQPLDIDDINVENYQAVAEFVRDYAVYDNPGEQAGEVFCKEDYTALPSREIDSKYFRTWTQFKAENPEVPDFARPKLQGMEEMLFQFAMQMLL
ncbi:MAG: uroporphyrinogen decarboxylase [Eubacteriaceae bacterium]|nr:uroporphyrinogen decarboxylase [Eubacteriaceae bacterium]